MEFFKKSVAPAGYKNKQCRKQTSVLSGRTVTAYVPLRSATERKRAAFLIPSRGYGDISLTFNLSLFSEVCQSQTCRGLILSLAPHAGDDQYQ